MYKSTLISSELLSISVPICSLIFLPITVATCYRNPKDPKTSRWLWDIRERVRQQKRTENFREIMRMQQLLADSLAEIDEEDDSAATREKLEKLTWVAEKKQLANYLSYGKWGLTPSAIERLKKDDEMRRDSLANEIENGLNLSNML